MLHVFALLTALIALAPGAAHAHGFGMRYDLPLPLDYFIWGGGAVVALSFVITAIFLRPHGRVGTYPSLVVTRRTFPILTGAIRIFAAFVFILTIVAGYIGAQNPYRNISIVMVWVIAWVGISYASAFLGNVWALINPWRIIFAWAERLGQRIGVRTLDLAYPAWLGTWPAFAQLFVFAWLELNWPGSGVPTQVATALVAFTILTWGGMYVFGREAWAKNGGVFVIVFGLFARFGIFEWKEGALRLRPPAVGLIAEQPASFSEMAFIILMLATVTYDGFTETELFQTLALALFEPLQGLGSIAVPIVSTIGLAAVPLIFITAYLIVAMLVRRAGGGTHSLATIAGSFVYSIVPIAIAYHLAHYLSLLIFEGQNVFALISDPFGYGWDLFGTAAYRPDLSVMNAEFLWFFSVTAIVLGHVAAVYLAHVEAVRLFATRRAALLSQVPMLVLMVGYTMVSLWIVAQPIVN